MTTQESEHYCKSVTNIGNLGGVKHFSPKLTLGTMRLLDVERSKVEWLSFLASALELGYQTLHNSCEYDSFPLLSELLKEEAWICKRPPFRHIVKLAEPSFDEKKFDTKRFET